MPPFTPEELETGTERVARLVGAATWSAVAGFVIAEVWMEEWPGAIFRLVPATGFLVAMAFSMPRLAVASYLGRGLASVICFAAGSAAGADHDPSQEETPGLTFVIMFVFGCVYLLGGLVALVVVKLLSNLGSGRKS